MKQILIFFFLCCSWSSMAQGLMVEDTLELERIESLNVWESNNLPSTENEWGVIGRVASWKVSEGQSDSVFFILLIFSILMLLLYLSSKNLILSVFKTLFNLQYAMQFSRSGKLSNYYYYLVYLVFYLIGSSLMFSFLPNNILVVKFGFISILLLVSAYFALDYLSIYIYTFFTTKKKTIDLVQSVSLSYSVFYGLLVWPALFLVLLTSLLVSKVFLIVFIGISLLILTVKEFRVFQILWIEKLNMFSFHFFAYLCTFKILPIALLIKLALY